jgi:hypothetical protein
MITSPVIVVNRLLVCRIERVSNTLLADLEALRQDVRALGDDVAAYYVRRATSLLVWRRRPSDAYAAISWLEMAVNRVDRIGAPAPPEAPRLRVVTDSPSEYGDDLGTIHACPYCAPAALGSPSATTP